MKQPSTDRPSFSQTLSDQALPSLTVCATHTRYWVIVFAVALAILQYVDRVCISQAAPLMSKDMGLSTEQMGFVFSAFTLAYALFGLPSGFLGDWIGPRKVLMQIVLWWSFFTAATGWVRSWTTLMLVRFLFGVGEAGTFPNLTKAFSRWLPEDEKMRAQGTMWMSARWGAALTPLMVYACLQFVTWRVAFMLFGLLGVAWALCFYLWFRDNPRDHKGVNTAELALMPPENVAVRDNVQVPWRKMVRSKTVWFLCSQYFACSYCFYFFITWFPTYLLQERGFDMKRSALLAGTPMLLGGFGSLFSGWISAYLGRWWGLRTARRTLGSMGFMGAAFFMVTSTYLHNSYWAIAAIAMASFCNDITMPAAWTSCMDVGGKSVGTLSGSMNMIGNLGGFLSPIVLGYIVGRTGNWNLTFYVTGGVCVLGALCWLRVDPVTPLDNQGQEGLSISK
jgi:MFS transporter, ACS family, glucarate transporter